MEEGEYSVAREDMAAPPKKKDFVKAGEDCEEDEDEEYYNCSVVMEFFCIMLTY